METTTLFLKGKFTAEQVDKYFKKFGKIHRVHCKDDAAFISLETDNPNRIISSLNGTVWNNCKIKLEFARKDYKQRWREDREEARKLEESQALRRQKRLDRRQVQVKRRMNEKRCKCVGGLLFPVVRMRVNGHVKVLDPSRSKKVYKFPEVPETAISMQPIELDASRAEKARKRRGSWNEEEIQQVVQIRQAQAPPKQLETMEFESDKEDEKFDNLSLFDSDSDGPVERATVSDSFLDLFNSDSD